MAKNADEDMLPEYEFDYSKGRPNPYAAMIAGCTRVHLQNDVSAAFGSSKAVNAALRLLLKPKATRKKSTPERNLLTFEDGMKGSPTYGSIVVYIEKDIALVFSTSKKVNAALRALMKVKTKSKKSA